MISNERRWTEFSCKLSLAEFWLIALVRCEMLVISDNADLTEKAYRKATVDGKIWLDGGLSRKKQVVPPRQESLI
jgi:inorganic pyrophosphatase/exopolyphosphatase